MHRRLALPLKLFANLGRAIFNDSRLPGLTKLNEYESSEKLVSRELASSTPMAAAFRGPRMSPTVMSQVSDFLAFDEPKSATGCMSSAAKSSCAPYRRG